MRGWDSEQSGGRLGKNIQIIFFQHKRYKMTPRDVYSKISCFVELKKDIIRNKIQIDEEIVIAMY